MRELIPFLFSYMDVVRVGHPVEQGLELLLASTYFKTLGASSF